MTAFRYHTMLSIAGSDPSGGAGIQADIKTASALGVYAMTAITAVTSQNTLGVRGFEAVSLSMLRSQLEAVVEDIRPDAVKIGMIPAAGHVEVIADVIRRYDLRNVVLDPVLVATSGDSLSGGDTVEVLLTLLAPLAAVITPNLPEAKALTGLPVSTPREILVAAHRLRLAGAQGVLIKGGHGGDDEIIDYYIDRDHNDRLVHARIETRNTHGTGCTLSSAIASFLALGYGAEAAVVRGVEWLQGAIRSGAEYVAGSGHGPVNHLYNGNKSQ